MRRIILLTAATAAALTLTACGSNSSEHGAGHNAAATTAAPATDHVAADVTFAQGMIPHHRGAIEMADLAPTRAKSPQVRELATKIKAAQDPEITTMTGWLRQWGEPEAAVGMSEHSGHTMNMGSSGGEMAGMSAEDMTMLASLNGPEFDRMFLTMMISHHQGAINMATAEQNDGRYGPAKELAGQIITSQRAEITQMQGLLESV